MGGQPRVGQPRSDENLCGVSSLATVSCIESQQTYKTKVKTMKTIFHTIRPWLPVTVFLFGFGFGFGNVKAQTPRTISHQGLLTDNTGTPVADSSRTMRFSIHSDIVGGTEFWSETKSVTTANGVYNTNLGSMSLITGVDFDLDLWLQIFLVDGSELLSPRTPLTAVPSAFALVLLYVGDADTSLPVMELLNAGSGIGIHGRNFGSGTGVRGSTNSGTGIYGITSSGKGVFGRAFDVAGVGGLFWGYENGNVVSPDIRLQGRGLISSTGTLSLQASNDTVSVNANLEIRKKTLAKDVVEIQTGFIGLPTNSGFNQDLIVETNDAQLGLYSDGVGLAGSGIQFGEVTNGSVRDR